MRPLAPACAASCRRQHRLSSQPVLTTAHSPAGRYTGVPYDQRAMRVQLGETLLMDEGQPLDFDTVAASKYLKETTAVHGTVRRHVSLPYRIRSRARFSCRHLPCFEPVANCPRNSYQTPIKFLPLLISPYKRLYTRHWTVDVMQSLHCLVVLASRHGVTSSTSYEAFPPSTGRHRGVHRGRPRPWHGLGLRPQLRLRQDQCGVHHLVPSGTFPLQQSWMLAVA